MYCDLYKWVVVFSDKVEYIHLYIYIRVGVLIIKKTQNTTKNTTHTPHTHNHGKWPVKRPL